MSLNYTPLRHQMLAKVFAGEVCRGLGAGGWGIKAPLPSGYGRCERTVDALVEALLIMIPGAGSWDTPLVTTGDGLLLLRRWTSLHGEPQ